MDTIDRLLEYMETRDEDILIENTLINKFDLCVIVMKILSWLKLEHKRTIWISQGRKNCLKPLELNVQYPWCAKLCEMVENEKVFHDYFSIKDSNFNFSDAVSEEDRVKAREKVYHNYNPPRFT